MLVAAKKVILSLGSNLGDREKHLEQAIQALKEDVFNSRVPVQVSSVYESPPWGYLDQPNYLNLVISGVSDWKPLALLNYFRTYEASKGRVRSVLNGPRVIDIDLVAYGDWIIHSQELWIPHPRFRDRDFVLVPLCEVFEDWVDPETGKTARQLLDLRRRQGPLRVKRHEVKFNFGSDSS